MNTPNPTPRLEAGSTVLIKEGKVMRWVRIVLASRDFITCIDHEQFGRAQQRRVKRSAVSVVWQS